MTTVMFLTGKAGVGKSTYASYLDSLFDETFDNIIKMSFADYIKDCAYLCFNWNGVKDEQGRTLLQEIGQTMRTYDRDWIITNTVDQCINLLTDSYEEDNLVIFTDVRFDREVLATKRMLGSFLERWEKGEVFYDVAKLTRTYHSKLTPKQKFDSTELGISEYLIDSIVDLDTDSGYNDWYEKEE